MFKLVAERIEKFAKERNWRHFHHPKNLIINIFAEFAELSEHLIALHDPTYEDLKNDPRKFEEICDELGDLFINLVHFSSATNIDIEKCAPASLSPTLPPSQVFRRLFVTLGFLAEPLTWINETESRTFQVTSEMPRILNEAISIYLFFAQQLGVDPVENALLKLTKIEKKWPIGSSDSDVSIHHRKKAKDRKSHNNS